MVMNLSYFYSLLFLLLLQADYSGADPLLGYGNNPYAMGGHLLRKVADGANKIAEIAMAHADKLAAWGQQHGVKYEATNTSTENDGHLDFGFPVNSSQSVGLDAGLKSPPSQLDEKNSIPRAQNQLRHAQESIHPDTDGYEHDRSFSTPGGYEETILPLQHTSNDQHQVGQSSTPVHYGEFNDDADYYDKHTRVMPENEASKVPMQNGDSLGFDSKIDVADGNAKKDSIKWDAIVGHSLTNAGPTDYQVENVAKPSAGQHAEVNANEHVEKNADCTGSNIGTHAEYRVESDVEKLTEPLAEGSGQATENTGSNIEGHSEDCAENDADKRAEQPVEGSTAEHDEQHTSDVGEHAQQQANNIAAEYAGNNAGEHAISGAESEHTKVSSVKSVPMDSSMVNNESAQMNVNKTEIGSNAADQMPEFIIEHAKEAPKIENNKIIFLNNSSEFGNVDQCSEVNDYFKIQLFEQFLIA